MRSFTRALAVALLFVATAASAGIPYRDDVVAYTSDQKGFTVGELGPLFNRLLQQSKPLIVFVHGRGDEPTKSLQGTGFVLHSFGFDGHAVPKLEQYGANVVMVSWDSKRGKGLKDRCRPLSNTVRGAEKLSAVLDALAKAVDALPTNAQQPRLTLLAHSMGNIVVQQYVHHNGWHPRGQKALFTTVILSSSDADNTGHAQWVEQIAKVERVFVTVNPNDRFLKQSEKARNEQTCSLHFVQPLGLEPGQTQTLAQDATYVRIEDTEGHEIFTQNGGRPEVTRFFAAAFDNQPLQFDGTAPGPVGLK